LLFDQIAGFRPQRFNGAALVRARKLTAHNYSIFKDLSSAFRAAPVGAQRRPHRHDPALQDRSGREGTQGRHRAGRESADLSDCGSASLAQSGTTRRRRRQCSFPPRQPLERRRVEPPLRQGGGPDRQESVQRGWASARSLERQRGGSQRSPANCRREGRGGMISRGTDPTGLAFDGTRGSTDAKSRR
jgi:hypothetical protein